MKFVKSSWDGGLGTLYYRVEIGECKLSHFQFSQYVVSANIAVVSKD